MMHAHRPFFIPLENQSENPRGFGGRAPEETNSYHSCPINAAPVKLYGSSRSTYTVFRWTLWVSSNNKLSDLDKHNRFLKWVSKNHIADAKNVGIDDIISIFDKVYDNIPKKVFLARWYPASTDENHEKANHRLNAIKSVVESLNLELIDLGTQDGGTFDIRSVMYNEINECDIFIADLTGCRHNVMVEVGYALRSDKERMLFYFAKTEQYSSPPFDLNGFRYELINDSAEIQTKVKPLIESILNGMD